MRSVLVGLFVVGLAFTLTACGGHGARRGGTQPSSLSIHLEELNYSGRAGTAKLTAEGDRVRVAIHMARGAPDGLPAYIQKGRCSTLDLRPMPTFRLNDVVDGKSSTVVDASLASLKKTAYAVTVHGTAKGVMNWTEPIAACGEIVESAAGG